MANEEILIEARRRAAAKAKYGLVKEQILLGKKDGAQNVLKELSALKREALFREHGIE